VRPALTASGGEHTHQWRTAIGGEAHKKTNSITIKSEPVKEENKNKRKFYGNKKTTLYTNQVKKNIYLPQIRLHTRIT
jgi:hypothetical protein